MSEQVDNFQPDPTPNRGPDSSKQHPTPPANTHLEHTLVAGSVAWKGGTEGTGEAGGTQLMQPAGSAVGQGAHASLRHTRMNQLHR